MKVDQYFATLSTRVGCLDFLTHSVVGYLPLRAV